MPLPPSVIVLWIGNALVILTYATLTGLDKVLFREIRFYRDRIVKEWIFRRPRVLYLAQVGLVCFGASGRSRGRFFFEQGKNPNWEIFLDIFWMSTGISIGDSHADRKMVHQMNITLARLSGRRVEEFEQNTTMKRFMRK
jgi:hypothetical protein